MAELTGDPAGEAVAFDCDAYGPEGREHRALCFFAGPGQRACLTQVACRAMMAAERRRVFRRISELAADGDPAAIYLAEEFTHPGQLLGGDDSGRPPGA